MADLPTHQGPGISELIALVSQLIEKVDQLENKLNEHVIASAAARATPSPYFVNAFPGGDYEAHRAYHLDVIEAMREKTVFWRKLRDSVATWGIIGVLGWITFTLWNAFIHGPKS